MYTPFPCGLTVGRTLAQCCSKIIVFGYYDGPTAGIIECKSDSQAFRFDMLDWDDEQDVRIFSLARLNANSFENILAALVGDFTPSWPVWMPDWRFETVQQEISVNKTVTQIIQAYEAPVCIAAWEGYTKPVLATGLLETKDAPILSSGSNIGFICNKQRDWFQWLGLSR